MGASTLMWRFWFNPRHCIGIERVLVVRYLLPYCGEREGIVLISGVVLRCNSQCIFSHLSYRVRFGIFSVIK